MHCGQDMSEADCEAGLASETAKGRHTEAATAAQEVGSAALWSPSSFSFFCHVLERFPHFS